MRSLSETTSSRPQQQVEGRQIGLDHLHLEELPPREDGVPEARLLVRYAAVQQVVEGVRRDGRPARRHLVHDGEGGLQIPAAPEGLDHVVVRHLRQDQVLRQEALSQHLGVLQRPVGERGVGAGVEEVAEDSVVDSKVTSPVLPVQLEGSTEMLRGVQMISYCL